MQNTLVSLCAAGLWHEADALIDHLVTLSEQQLARALQETHGTPAWTSLHYAAICNPTPPTLAKLVAHGADLHARGNSGSTALHLAAWSNTEHAAQLLLSHGANVEASSKNGRTPLMFAARRGNCNMMHALVQHGADLHARDQRGRTALHFAAQSGRADAMHALLRAGAEDSSDADGVTAAELADMEEALHVAHHEHHEHDDVRSDWTLTSTLCAAASNVRGWGDRLAASLVGRHSPAADPNASLPPSAPPSPVLRAGDALLGAGDRPVRRGE
ncbi:unnamed protein product, partial [Agarophyton chilense]